MAILDRESLEQSPLADLHAIASELSIDGYRRLRKAELISAILERQDGETAEGAGADGAAAGGAAADAEEPETARPASRRRGRRRRSTGSKAREEGPAEIEQDLERGDEQPGKRREEEPGKRRGEEPRERRGEEPRERPGEEPVEGVVELLPNGSGFVRVDPPDPSDADVYISSAQVRRCELVTGDRVSGPRRAPRRSERFAALVRIDTINGRPAAELADSTRYDDLPASFPSERLALESDGDPAVQGLASATPIGRGSRVTIAGPAQSGKTELLRRLAAALAGQDELQVSVVLAGVRPEEIQEWRDGPAALAATLSLAASQDAQAQAVEGTVEQARRMAARGAHAVVMIDTLEELPPQTARKALASARRLESGSLTVIATAPDPLGGETTVIVLDRALAREGSFPAINPDQTWTMRAELLQG
jgi:transcription termination factor Rho